MLHPDHRIGYVTKMYPRFSETFIVSEVIAREAQGEHIEIISLRPPADGRFHALLARVAAPVHYLTSDARGPTRLWACLGAHHRRIATMAAADDLWALDPRDALQVLELADLVEARGLTHLHAHFATIGTTIARLAAQLTGITYSFTAHAKDIFHEDVDHAQLAAKLRDAHHVVTVSDYNVADLTRRFGNDAAGVTRVYNGLLLEDFTYSPPEQRTPSVDVVAVGRLVEKKGFATLIDAVAATRDAARPLTCRIIGTGELEDALRSQVAEAGVGDLVELVGPLPQDRVRHEVRAAGCVAAPCVVGADGNADGLPTVILEAMALGTPVVTTDVTGIVEAVRHDDTGLIVAQHDAQDLAAALVAVADDPTGRTDLAAAARRLVEAEFTSPRQAAQLRDLLPGVRIAAEVA